MFTKRVFTKCVERCQKRPVSHLRPSVPRCALPRAGTPIGEPPAHNDRSSARSRHAVLPDAAAGCSRMLRETQRRDLPTGSARGRARDLLTGSAPRGARLAGANATTQCGRPKSLGVVHSLFPLSKTAGLGAEKSQLQDLVGEPRVQPVSPVIAQTLENACYLNRLSWCGCSILNPC